MTEPRTAELVVIAGRNSVGKTTLGLRLVQGARRPMLVSPVVPGWRWADEPFELVREAIAGGSSAIVLDDADVYVREDKLTWGRLFATHRHLGVDVVLLTRSPQRLPPVAIAAARRILMMASGPREHAWCEANFARTPPAEPFRVVEILL